MGRLCSPDAEDAAGALSAELQALTLLHRPPVVAPEDKGHSPGQFTAQYHRLSRCHTEWGRGCLKELDWGLWREREREEGISLGLLPPPLPGLAGSTHQPG